MPKRDMSARYDAVRAKAQAVNHDLRIIVAPGRITLGQDFTLKPFEVDALDLGPALDRIEQYLTSPKAAERGELYRKLDEAKDAEEVAHKAWRAALDARIAAVKVINDDTDDELSEAIDMTAGQLRADLTAIDTPAAKAALDAIENLDDDEVVSVEPEDD